GADVFMSTFAKLKSFPFFSRISNWFLPFHTDNSAVTSSFAQSDKFMLDMILALPVLCDSDKYSFCLSMASVPASQKQMMAGQFRQQNDMLKEMGKNLPKSKEKTHEEIANRFIQGLFRFSKLNKYHAEFFDPFSTSLNLREVPVLAPILDNTDTLSIIGEYCMKNEHYHEAIDCFTRITEIDAEVDASFIQKRGFCNQCLKNYPDAIDDYLKFDLFSPDNLWNITHTAACYRALRQNDRALECYRRAEALAPENISVCLNIGHCLLDLGNTAEALKAYYKVDYLDSSKHRALRPIAWCTFLLGNFEQSLKYYDKVLADNPSAHDYLNIGHLHLCRRDFECAARHYRLSLDAFGSKDDFLNAFSADTPYLTDKGITPMERDLILDYLAFS
ncbi:MAG: tetratricopeptide repeat protein, partial [Muribaculaceae bacterium]